MAYPTPLGSSAPDGPNAFEALAAAVQADVDVINAELAAIDVANARRAYAEAAGSGTINMSSGTNYAEYTVALPSGRFTFAPRVTVSISSADGGSQKLNIRATNVTTTSCIVRVYTGDFPSAVSSATTVTFNWIAVQMKSNAASG